MSLHLCIREVIKLDKMVAFRCRSCGNTYYPKRPVCPACHSREFEEVELGRECKLLTYTELYATPLGIEKRPLVLGIVEFESGIRAVSYTHLTLPTKA